MQRYHAIPRDEFLAALDAHLKALVPTEFKLGSADEVGDIRFRLVSLPDDPTQREARIEDILKKGTDRTDPKVTSRYDSLYRQAARLADCDPLDVFDCISSPTFYRRAESGYFTPDAEGYMGANGVIIYDALRDSGIKRIRGPEYTFKDTKQREKAILAIVGLG